MTFIEIIDTFTFYGIDVMLLAAGCALLTQLLKKTIFKRAQKKVVTFLPFVIGIILYAAYAAIRNLSFVYLLCEYTTVLEHGISVGAVATMYYVMYEQFIREKSSLSETESVIATLIEGYVPSEKLEEAAKQVAESILKDVTGNGAAKTEEILKGYADGEINERNLHLLSRLIIETLAHINSSN